MVTLRRACGFRVLSEEKTESPRSRRLWVKLESDIRTPQELLLEGFFLSWISIAAQWLARFVVRFVKLLSVT